MDEWREDKLQSVLTARDKHELFEALSFLARALGFDYWAYGLRTPVPISRPRVMMFNNYPTGWQNRYHEKRYLSTDPTVKHGMRSSLPLLWSDDAFASARDLWDEARSFGLRYGWAQSSIQTNGVVGLLNLARSHEPLSERERQYKVAKITWLTQFIHVGISRCVTTKLLPETDSKLTEREIIVLRWTADGKTSGEIAEILGVAERTVNFHVNNAIEKLRVPNKLAAAVKAVALGML